MAIGDDPETLLAPYDENIEMEPYERGEVSEKEINDFSKYYKEKYDENTNLSIYELYEKHGEDWNGRSWKKVDGKWIEFSTYNPDSKWDWYQLGGRWNGFFKLKKGAIGESGTHYAKENAPSGYADSCKKGDIDTEGMRNEFEEIYAKRFDFIHSKIDGLQIEHKWSDLLAKSNSKEITIEEAREIYHNQEIVKVFKEAAMSEEGRKIIGFMADVEEYIVPRSFYLKIGRESAIVPYAIVNKDGWFEKGEMGWWGMSNDKYTDAEWSAEFSKLFDELPDDTLINLIDCHI